MSRITAANSAVGIFSSSENAVKAVQEFKLGDFDIKRLSIIGRNYHSDEKVVGYYNTGGRMKYWGKEGAFWAGMWDSLTSAGFFLIPGIGPLMVAGPVVKSILDAIDGAAVMGDSSIVIAALSSMGIPRESLLPQEIAIKMGKLILIYGGSPEEVENAKNVFVAAKAIEARIYLAESPVVV